MSAPIQRSPVLEIDYLRAAAAPMQSVLPAAAWLPYALVRKPDGRLDKPPKCKSTTSNPESWFTLENALVKLRDEPGIHGIGFAITKGIITLDFDDCRDPVTGELTPEVQAELERFDSFAYVTPSGKGIRIVGTGDLQGRKRNCYLPSGKKVEVFVGPTNHFNTFTSQTIEGYAAIRDISDGVTDYLNGLPGYNEAERGAPPPASATPERCIEAIKAALTCIPNDRQDWEFWTRYGMAVWRSSGGAGEGREAWRDWSAKHPCHDDNELDASWARFHRSPPTRIGFGTLYHDARLQNPLFVPPYDPVDLGGLKESAHDPETGEILEPGKSRQGEPLLLSISELEALPPPLWLVDGLVPERSLVMPYGPPKQGKTFVILSMALHIAASMDWMGKAVQGGGVIYIAGEGLGGLGLRVKAMREHYQIRADIPFWIARRAINFGSADAVGHLLQVVRDTAQGKPIVLVVVDTLARAAPGVEENSSKEMGVVVAACDRVRDELGCTVMPIHHTGKDDTKGLRGSSAIHGAVDASFKISTSGDRTKLEPMDQKDADPGPPMIFEMKEIMVGISRNSLVPVLADAEIDDGQPKKHNLHGQEELALRALKTSLERFGEIITGSANVPANVPVCKDETWREGYKNLKPDIEWQSARVTFRRVASKLIEKRIVGCYAPYVWII